MVEIVSQQEANIIEDIRAGVTFNDCLIKYHMRDRNLLNICQRLTSLDLLHKVKSKHYNVTITSYKVLPTKQVTQHRKSYKAKLFSEVDNNLPEEAAFYIIGHYPYLSRTMLLQRLNDQGFHINKFELNVFIITNELDKIYKRRDRDVAS